jgi:hypothetical protein
LALLLAAPWSDGRAGVLGYCDPVVALNPAQQDSMLRWSGLIKAELEGSGAALALIARSGLDLSRFGQRYSHAGLSLKASPNGPWSVRQLYYACEERRPRLYDQGLAGFILGTDDPVIGYVSLVLLPPAQAAALEGAALDDHRALQILNPAYSANAYPFDLRYQNCNQWLLELLANAWGQPPEPTESPRASAQRWLRAQDYQPSRFELVSPVWLLAGSFIPWVHSDDHPEADLAQAVYQVSMPDSIEAFVRRTVPGSSRVELCHRERWVVIHTGWEPIAEGCQPGPGDRVVELR